MSLHLKEIFRNNTHYYEIDLQIIQSIRNDSIFHRYYTVYRLFDQRNLAYTRYMDILYRQKENRKNLCHHTEIKVDCDFGTDDYK